MSDERATSEQQQQPPAFKWNARRVVAARDVAEDELTDQEIATAAGVSRQTLTEWKKNPDFAARVAELVEEARNVAARHAIGRKARRIRSMNDRWARLQRIIDARATDPDLAGYPGGDTGLLVRRVKVVGTGELQERVVELELDHALLREMRELEKAVAIELNQIDRPNAPPPPEGDPPLYARADNE